MGLFSTRGDSAYDVKNELPEDQYGRHRDRLNQQQLARKVEPKSRLNLALIFATLTFVGVLFGGLWLLRFFATLATLVGVGAGTTPMWLNVGVFLLAVVLALIVWDKQSRRSKGSDLLNTDGVINDYADDMHIQLPEEVLMNFPIVPDNGAHFSEDASFPISHIYFDAKNSPMVQVPRRYRKTGEVTLEVRDDDGKLVKVKEKVYAGEYVRDADGNIVKDVLPMIDQEQGIELFAASGIKPDNKVGFKFYNAKKLPYGLGEDRPFTREVSNDKGFKEKLLTMYDVMAKDWEIPDYETQRPSGAYLVDTNPVNNLVIAITRGGKGQTVIEVALDIWSRQKRQWNIFANDPKGELLVKFFYPFSKRGYEIVQFNLINPMKTDVYNPLGYAVEAAREGNYPKVAEFLTNLSEIFFPKDGGEDKVWPESAAAAFERSCLGMIDYFLEEEREMRRMAEKNGVSGQLLDSEINNMWGKVTLFNCFQFFLSLVSKKETNPARMWVDEIPEDHVIYKLKPTGEKTVKEGEEIDVMTFDLDENGNKVIDWDAMANDEFFGAPEPKALLDVFFDATQRFPKSGVREQIDSSNNTLKTMMQSEKMLSSVYGIATSGMRFFADPTIISLTSGAASQNFDIQSLSFPRRAAVRFSTEWMERYRYAGKLTRWSAYSDDTFTEKLDDKLFGHDQIINRDGWSRYAFDGKFDGMHGYIKMDVIDPANDLLMESFYFRADLAYQTSLDGRHYVKNPVTNERVIRNGKLTELQLDEGSGRYVPKNTTIVKRIRNFAFYEDGEKTPEDETVRVHAFSALKLYYAASAKAVFFVTPPHLMPYARLILILIKQVTDSAMESAYMTKGNQKPLYGTRYMLDELGNLQSDGHGIPKLETMLSIGLSAMQQFTLILQTMQQLISVYGDDVDKIIKGNTNNIVFLKSTDISMIDELVSLAGKTHTERQNSISITENTSARVNKVDERVTRTKTVIEEDVLSRNSFLKIKPRESIVLAAGENPIYNQESMILPMAWRLHKNQIRDPYKEYTLQTVPTMSSTLEFDPRRNQPNFYAMVEKRARQARLVTRMEANYRKVYGYTQIDIDRMDPDVYANEIMDAVNDYIRETTAGGDTALTAEAIVAKREKVEQTMAVDAERGEIVHNDEWEEAVEDAERDFIPDYDKPTFAGGRVSPNMLVDKRGQYGNADALAIEFKVAVKRAKGQLITDDLFTYDDENETLSDAKTGELYVSYANELLETISDGSITDDSDIDDDEIMGVSTTQAFSKFLYEHPNWGTIADGMFLRYFNEIYDAHNSMDNTEAF